MSKIQRTKMSTRMKACLTAGVVASSLMLAGTVATPAQAVTVRPGARFGQVDVMLTTRETEAVRRSAWAATVVCWQSGVVGIITTPMCVAETTVCAAQAYYSSPRRRGAFTVTPWGQAWCWKY